PTAIDKPARRTGRFHLQPHDHTDLIDWGCVGAILSLDHLGAPASDPPSGSGIATAPEAAPTARGYVVASGTFQPTPNTCSHPGDLSPRRGGRGAQSEPA